MKYNLTTFLLDYVILSCVFNFFYYSFNWSSQIKQYLSKRRDSYIQELEKENPNDPFLDYLKEESTIKNQIDYSKGYLLKLVKDIVLFPINALILFLINIENRRKG